VAALAVLWVALLELAAEAEVAQQIEVLMAELLVRVR